MAALMALTKRNALSGALVPVSGPDGGVVWQSWTYGELLQHLTNDLVPETAGNVPTGLLLQAPTVGAANVVKLWWGSVMPGGAINLAGSGSWTVSRSAVGVYAISITNGPAGGTALMVPQQEQGDVSASLSSGAASPLSASGAGSITVNTFNAGVAADMFWSFIIVGWG